MDVDAESIPVVVPSEVASIATDVVVSMEVVASAPVDLQAVSAPLDESVPAEVPVIDASSAVNPSPLLTGMPGPSGDVPVPVGAAVAAAAVRHPNVEEEDAYAYLRQVSFSAT